MTWLACTYVLPAEMKTNTVLEVLGLKTRILMTHLLTEQKKLLRTEASLSPC